MAEKEETILMETPIRRPADAELREGLDYYVRTVCSCSPPSFCEAWLLLRECCRIVLWGPDGR